jgi:hypothetical protein
VNLSSNVIGANLQLRDSGGTPITSATFLGFAEGEGYVCPSGQTFTIVNTGNEDVQVQIGSGEIPFSSSALSPPIVAAGGSSTFDVQVFSDGQCSGDGVFTFTTTGDVCSVPLVLSASFNVSGEKTCFCAFGS